MRKSLIVLALCLVPAFPARAQNFIHWFPQVAAAEDLNAYLVLTQGASLGVHASDACLPGDIWLQIGLGLPGPDIRTSQTDGSAEGCVCSQHAGGYDASFTLPGPILAIVIQRLVQPAASFPASSEMRLETGASLLVATQFRGIDACGVEP